MNETVPVRWVPVKWSQLVKDVWDEPNLEAAARLIESAFAECMRYRIGLLDEDLSTLRQRAEQAEAKFQAESVARSLQIRTIRDAVHKAMIPNGQHRARIEAAIDTPQNVAADELIAEVARLRAALLKAGEVLATGCTLLGGDR